MKIAMMIILEIWLTVAFFARITFSQCNLGECITDFNEDDCSGENYYYQEHQTVNECCPGCVEFAALNEPCDDIMRCAPGLMCINDVCAVDRSSCLHHQFIPDETVYQPSCYPNGTYRAVQCKGNRLTGRCFCSDAEGNRIFGTEWRSQAEEMTCACSRRRSELEKTGRTITLHCTSDGSFETLQCDKGMCWCADHDTGAVISTVVTDTMMELLPCYLEFLVGSQYLRQCESEVVARTEIHNQQIHHGTNYIYDINTFCGYDGNYGNMQISDGVAYCTWRNGSSIMSYQTPAGANLATMNCNCARDNILYQEAGLTFTMSCSGNGNYASRQQSGGRYYCVDQDGFPTTEVAELGVDIDCP